MREFSDGTLRLGLDIGSLYIKAVILRESSPEPVRTFFEPHCGKPLDALKKILKNLDIKDSSEVYIGITGTNISKTLSKIGESINPVKALRIAVLRRFPDTRNIIDIGGCSVTMVHLDEKGEFINYTTNSLCAAGTGSFLDQQSERLGVSYDETNRFSQVKEPPTIATRCAVFAKTDLIHRQQEGYSREELWSGLCRGMTNTFMQMLLRGKKLSGRTVITGGVALNPEVIRWLREKFGEIQCFPEPVFAQAIGSALVANSKPTVIPESVKTLGKKQVKSKTSRLPLVLKKTKYPDWSVLEEWVDDSGTEIRVLKPLNSDIKGYIGIDIGSTSTKLVLMNEKEEVLFDLYRKTSGDPVGATQLLFKAIQEIQDKKALNIEILGSGTTGSGRKLVGNLIGADIIINEISAHATGTLKIDPEIETIFEIGGQDSKYIYLKNGRMSQCNMNYVCAAGTGSFIEEQGNKLGFSVKEIGDLVMGISPPPSSERCTVFMEQDINNLLLQGFDKEEVIAAILYSVAQNYLTKVVGKRPVSGKKIFFQGATARNKALVAAFENILNREIVVSPLCHVMGAYGTAILVKKRARERTRFKGIDFSKRKVKLTYERCDICTNYCKITFADIEGEKEPPSWGYMCGRDPSEDKKREVLGFTPFKRRQEILARTGNVFVKNPTATIGIPRYLINLSYLPLWKKFLGELGFRVFLSPSTNDKIMEKGVETSGADFCFPIKVAHGHISHLLESNKIDRIFIPHFISFIPEKSSYPVSFLCPYVQSLASVAKKTFKKDVLSPVIDFHWTEKRIISELYREIGKPYKIQKKRIKQAWLKAVETQRVFFKTLQEEGKKFIENVKDRGILIIGRPYNTMDEKASLNIPYKFAENFKLTVLPIDMIPNNPEGIDENFKMFWNYGKLILNGLKFVRDNPNWFGVFLSNFGCGPDSFLLSYAEEMMEDKPFLILELDEHGSDGGYQTRMEAFMDAVNSFSTKSYEKFNFNTLNEKREMSGCTLWIPPLHPVGSRLFASAFRRYGYDARALPEETPGVLEIGRSLVRGNECLPTALTIGNFVNKLKKIEADPKKHALFMATSDGPCRFGQYIVLHRLILNHLGYEETTIIAPSSHNTYYGLPDEMRPFIWKVILISDTIYKTRCRIKPYEKNIGETEKLYKESIEIMEKAISEGKDIYPVFNEVLNEFRKIKRISRKKPLVGIVGEIYIRCNPFSNDYVIQEIESAGGEAWLSPVSEWILYTGFMNLWHSRHQGNIKEMLKAEFKNIFLHREEKKLLNLANDIIGDREEPDIKEIIERGSRYVPINFGTEALLTLGRASLFVEQGAKLIVNTAPFTCMPGTITTALFNHIQTEMKVPVVNFFYDGKRGESAKIKTYIENLP